MAEPAGSQMRGPLSEPIGGVPDGHARGARDG
jgi:hypothetical protein